jgi:purine-nucleoside/S-methyl-5'-thioadenosine phosphorylase / adenosine deaminase
LDVIKPDWPVADSVKAFMTTRQGGVSQGPFASMNLGDHVGDDPARVRQNRNLLLEILPSEPHWLQQVHGRDVSCADDGLSLPRADASFSCEPGNICVVMMADCLPVLLCDEAGTVVAAAHAGWRGLAGGVLEAAVQSMQTSPARILAWMGAAIGPQAFEVGEEVRDVFVQDIPASSSAFMPGNQPGKWWADIYQLARFRLTRAGVSQVFGGGLCTYTDSQRFYSFRRDGTTGRMASLIWLQH